MMLLNNPITFLRVKGGCRILGQVTVDRGGIVSLLSWIGLETVMLGGPGGLGRG
jgi:hypothetical protein